jgi:hypothetical protein
LFLILILKWIVEASREVSSFISFNTFFYINWISSSFFKNNFKQNNWFNMWMELNLIHIIPLYYLIIWNFKIERQINLCVCLLIVYYIISKKKFKS